MEWAYNGGVEREKMEGCFFYADCDAIAQKLTILYILRSMKSDMFSLLLLLEGKKNDQMILYKERAWPTEKRKGIDIYILH